MSLHAKYFLSESLRAFRKTKWMSLATVATIGICLFLSLCVSFSIWYVHVIISRSEAKMEMVAFLEEEYASADSSLLVQAKLRDIEGVANAIWISKDSSLQIFKKLYGTEMLEAVDENPLPASFHIKPEPSYIHRDSLSVLQARFYAVQGVEEVGYGKEWLPRLEQARRIFIVVAIVVGLLAFSAFYWMISTTVRFTFYARKDIFDIMRYVGATDTFIKIPFYAEALLKGLLGSTASLIMFNLLLKMVSRRFEDFDLILTRFPFIAFVVTITGCALTLISSKNAVARHLK